MKCEDVRRMLSAFADSEIGGRRKSRIQDHLSSCACCANEAEALRALQSRLREGLLEHDDLPDLTNVIMFRIPERHTLSRWALGMAVAACATTLVACCLQLRNTPQRADRATVSAPVKQVVTHQAVAKKTTSTANTTTGMAQQSRKPNRVARTRTVRRWVAQRPAKREAQEGQKAFAPKAEGSERPPETVLMVTRHKRASEDGSTKIEVVAITSICGHEVHQQTVNTVTALPLKGEVPDVERPALQTTVKQPTMPVNVPGSI